MNEDPWFLWSWSWGRLSIEPVGRAGWSIVLGYAVLAAGMGWFWPDGLSPAAWWSWIVIFVALTIGFVAVIWLKSMSEAKWKRRKR